MRSMKAGALFVLFPEVTATSVPTARVGHPDGVPSAAYSQTQIKPGTNVLP